MQRKKTVLKKEDLLDLEDKAAKGDSKAQCILGDIYLEGKAIPEDPKKAIELYQAAAKQGNVDGQKNLGFMYLHGLYVPKNEKKAAELYQAAAKQGDADALYNLGVIYARLIPINYKKIAQLYQAAADKGHAPAQSNLALMYRDAQGVPKDEKKAAELFQAAATQGNVSAQHNLGMMYLNGLGVPKNITKSAELLQAAANQGSAISQFNLAVLHASGTGVVQDTKKAVELYQAAATQGNVNAQYNLGTMYLNGLGVPKNITKAAELLLAAANQGHAISQSNPAVLYASGTGVGDDTKIAVALNQAAANHDSAMHALLQNKIAQLESMSKATSEKKPSHPNETSAILKKKRKPKLKKPMNRINASTAQTTPNTTESKACADNQTMISKANAANLSINSQPSKEPESKLSKLQERANLLIDELYADNPEKIEQEKSEISKIKDRNHVKEIVIQLQRALSQKEGHGENPKKISSDVKLDDPKPSSDKKDSDTTVVENKKNEKHRDPYAGKSRKEKRKLIKAKQAQKEEERLQPLIEKQKQVAKNDEIQISNKLQNKAIEETLKILIAEQNQDAHPEDVEKKAEKLLQELKADNVFKPVTDLKLKTDEDLPKFNYGPSSLEPNRDISINKPSNDKKSDEKKSKKKKKKNKVDISLFNDVVKFELSQQSPASKDGDKQKSKQDSPRTSQQSASRLGLFAPNGIGNASSNPLSPIPAPAPQPKPSHTPAETGSIMYNVNSPGIYKKK